jgi:hypothetical protein
MLAPGDHVIARELRDGMGQDTAGSDIEPKGEDRTTFVACMDIPVMCATADGSYVRR